MGVSGVSGGAGQAGVTDAPDDYVALFEREFERLARSLRAVDASADDAVQEAFVQAFLRWGRVRTMDDPAGWIRRVAVNRLLNVRRNRRRQEAAVARLESNPAGTAPPENPEVLDAVRSLSRQQRVAVALYYGAGLPVDEVADAMRLTAGTVKFHLHAGRERLRALLEDPTHG